MEEAQVNHQKSAKPLGGLVVAAALVGVATLVFLWSKRNDSGKDFDFEDLASACEKAAERLERALGPDGLTA